MVDVDAVDVDAVDADAVDVDTETEADIRLVALLEGLENVTYG